MSTEHVDTVQMTAALSRQLGELLMAKGQMCATAESCTGGLVGHLITEVAGSSAWFAGGAITYSYAAKEKVLGVQHETLMTQGARQLYDVAVAVAITGVAGPGGGSAEKPVGLVHIHLSSADGVERAERFIWSADRSGNKLLSAQAALQMLVDYAAR